MGNFIGNNLSFISKLRESRFIKDVSIVAGGTAAAQLITVAFSPVITRLYSPDMFGVFGVFTALVAVIVPIANLAYPHAIVIPAADYKAKALIKVSLLFTSLITLLLLLILLIYNQQVASLAGFNFNPAYLLLWPFGVFILSSEQLFSNWLIRKKNFKPISVIAVIQSLVTNSSMTFFGFFLASAPVLIIFYIFGHLIQAALLLMRSIPTLTKKSITGFVKSIIQMDDLKETALEYRDFPQYRLPQILINSLTQNLPVLMLAALFDPLSAGFYVLTRRVLNLPVSLISKSVGKVFLPRFADAANTEENLQPLLLKSTFGLALIGLVPFGTVVLFGPWLFGTIFGAEWVTAGEYARWLSLLLFFQFINVPSVKAYPVLGLQGHLLIYEVLAATMRITTIAIGAYYLESDIIAIALFSIGGALLYLVLIVWVIKYCSLYRR